MSDENKTANENKCLCQSEGFRKFIIVALGSFVGVFCALSLFAALHKPPMMVPPPCAGYFRPCPMQIEHVKKFEHFDKHRMPRPNFEKQRPFNPDKIKDND